jgi:RNA ligase (TIGR02306 family)
MSTFKVIKTNIEIFDHPNADSLQLGKVGNFQVVVKKGLYKGGEEVLFAPEKSILTGVLLEEYKPYLGGKEHNRVSSIRLRGELSCGIIIPEELVWRQCGKKLKEIPSNENLQELLGISKYIPEVPLNMRGTAQVTENTYLSSDLEVEHYGIYENDFIPGERVIATEKIHGTQLSAYSFLKEGKIVDKWITTKNYNHKGLDLKEDPENFYWKAAYSVRLFEEVESIFKGMKDGVIQVYAEAIPAQKGYGYGYTTETPTLRFIDLRKNTKSVPLDELPKYFKDLWAPVLYDGPFENIEGIKNLAKGKELVSGKELHIKEGLVLRPYIDRRAKDGTRLYTKIINPKYKETGEELN